MSVEVVMGALRTEETGDAVGAWPWWTPPSAPRVSRCVVLALAPHHPGSLFPDLLSSETGFLAGAAATRPAPAQPALEADRPSWHAGLGSCRRGQLRTVASQEACPSAHPTPLTHLFSWDMAAGTGGVGQEAFAKLWFLLSG